MQEGQAAYYPPLSSSLSSTHPSNLVVDTIQGRSLAAPSGDISNCTCSNGSHFDRSGTCSSNSSITATSNQLTPPEHVLTSCPSSSFSASTAASGSSPTLYPDFLYPPHPSQSVLSLSNSGSVISIGNCAPYHFQHHLPKSLSRSSISSNGSTLLFSPSLEAQNLQNYSPLTPPLPLPLEDTSNKGKSLAPQTVVKPSRSAKLSLDLPKSSSTSQVPILPKMEGTNEPSTSRTSSKSSMLVVTPACISQLATYLAEMIVYLWFSPPQKRAPTFPKPTSAFARFCNDILTTTQVSQSVVVLALYFVCKLQTKHSIEPRQGSEYKLTIASLMLANKILDDHTYTNKTWSEVSGLPLGVLNGAEVEFLQGLEFDLHVSHTAYLAWYTMLQNGESSIIVKQAAPARKRAKIVNPIAPSAPTSPLHHTTSSSTSTNSGIGFDFNFSVPSVTPAAGSAYAPSTLQPASAWPSNYFPPIDPRHMHTMMSSERPSGAEPTFPTRRPSNRKRRLSDAALSPPRETVPTQTLSQRNTPLRIAVDNNASSKQIMPALHALPQHMYTPIVSTPMTPTLSTGPTRSSTPNAHTQPSQDYPLQNLMLADFNALTSSWTPDNGAAERRPQDLTYYALAAGQQRGGYLTHQPLQPYHPLPMQYYHAAPPMNQASDGRMYAPLPRNALLGSAQNESTPLLQQVTAPPRMTLSLSPVDMRVVYQQPDEHQHDHSVHYNSQMLAPGYPHTLHSGTAIPAQTRHMPSVMTHGHMYPEDQRFSSTASSHRGVPYSQTAHPSPLEPSLQNLALSGHASHGTASPIDRIEPEQQQQLRQAHFQSLSAPYQSYQSYYSSFANNGLPGVLSWPVQAIAKYHNVVQPQ